MENEIQAIKATLQTIEYLERYYNENFYDPAKRAPLKTENSSYAIDAFNDIFNAFDHNSRAQQKAFEQLIFSKDYESFVQELDGEHAWIDSCIDGFESD